MIIHMYYPFHAVSQLKTMEICTHYLKETFNKRKFFYPLLLSGIFSWIQCITQKSCQYNSVEVVTLKSGQIHRKLTMHKVHTVQILYSKFLWISLDFNTLRNFFLGYKYPLLIFATGWLNITNLMIEATIYPII